MGMSGVSTSAISAIAAITTIDASNRRQLLAAAQAKNAVVQNAAPSSNQSSSQDTNETNATVADTNAVESSSSAKKSAQFSAADTAQLAKLQARDRQVRLHEMAHLAASGGLATSGASFTYQKGPDGVDYAVGGEVGIDTSPGRTPEDTIARARQIQAAALAPADPSGQDRSVAAMAQQMEIEANTQLMLRKTSEGLGQSNGVVDTSNAHDSVQKKINQVQQTYSTSTINSIISVYA